jgi:hypothetical protein
MSDLECYSFVIMNTGELFLNFKYDGTNAIFNSRNLIPGANTRHPYTRNVIITLLQYGIIREIPITECGDAYIP